MMMSSTEGHGYDLDFLEDPPEYLKCILCQLVLRDPVVLIACGHHYCSTCFERVKGYSAHTNVDLVCPLDRMPIDVNKVIKDVFTNRLIQYLKVKCTHHSLGCEWVGEVMNLEEHKTKCSYNEVSSAANNEQNTNDHHTKKVVRQLCERMDHLEKDLQEKGERIQHLSCQLTESKELVERKCKDIENLENKLVRIEQVLDDKTVELNELKDWKVEVEEKLDGNDQEIAGLMANIENKKNATIAKFEEVKKEIAACTVMSGKLEKEIENARLAINKQQQDEKKFDHPLLEMTSKEVEVLKAFVDRSFSADSYERLIESTSQLIPMKRTFFTWEIPKGEKMYYNNRPIINSKPFFSYKGYQCYLQLTYLGCLSLFVKWGKPISHVAEIECPTNLSQMTELYNKMFKFGGKDGSSVEDIFLHERTIKTRGYYFLDEPVTFVCVLTHTCDDILAVQILSGPV